MLNDFDRRLEVLQGFETDYVKLLYYDLPKDFSSVYKTYNYTRFCTILSGEKQVTIDNKKTFTYGKNDYLLLPANTTVQMEMGTNTKALVFELNDDLIEDVFSKVNLEEQMLHNLKQDKNYHLGHNKWNVQQDAIEIFKMAKQNKKNSAFLIDLYVQKLVFDLIQDKSTHHILESDANNPMNITLKYINQNIHSPINMGELADQLYMSESSLSHLFKKTMGMTAGEYIKDKKLELASYYLKTDSVTDVAYNLGYMNISYFIKIFKEKYTLTPKQYKLTYYNN